MNKAGFLFLGAVLSAGSFLFIGCGGDTGTGGGGAGGGVDASSSSSGSPASSSSGGPASSSSGGAAVAATAASYCKDVIANCTGDSAQIADDATCQKIAASFTPGTIGATSGNSLECRAYHAGAPSKMTPAMHCAHAGITGGDLDPTATGMGKDGPCGDGVEAFCKLAVEICTGQPGAYADVAACTAEATKFKVGTVPFSTKETSGDTFNCRAYHLTVASKDATSATTHCPHIKLVSDTCK